MRLIDVDALIADLEYDVELDARALDCLDNESRRDIIQFDKDCKQNAIDLLRKAPTAQPEQVCVATVTLTDEQVKEVAEKAKNAVISVIEPETHWILCGERLPNHDEYIKNNGLFIVSDGNRSYSEWYDIYDKRKFGEPTMSGFRIDYAVTAWMPLPEPYKGGETE